MAAGVDIPVIMDAELIDALGGVVRAPIILDRTTGCDEILDHVMAEAGDLLINAGDRASELSTGDMFLLRHWMGRFLGVVSALVRE